MSSKDTQRIITSASCLLVVLILLGLQQTLASDEKINMQTDVLSHPVTPGTPIPTPPSKYSLPFNRNENAVITLGPGEPDTHTGKSSEAIDFSPKTYGWTQILAVKPGHVYINEEMLEGWGNLVVVKSDVGGSADAFYAYYAHLANPPNLALDQQIADRQVIGTVGQTGCTAPCIHIHTELRDLMQNRNYNSGNSTNHPIRRVRGIGWYPWYPDADMNSGFVPRSTTHPLAGCSSNACLTMRWPAPSEFDHFDNSTNTDQLAGYSWSWSTNPNDVPDTIQEGTPSTYTGTVALPVTSTTTKWFFHIRARGVTSGWAADNEVAHQGPYKIRDTCAANPAPEDWNDIPGMDE